jgi:hypothetical protein
MRVRTRLLAALFLLSACEGAPSESTDRNEPIHQNEGGKAGVPKQDDLPLGPNDKYAKAACEALGGETSGMVRVEASTDKALTELSKARLSLEHKPYLIQLPENAESFVRLDEFHWNVTVAIFAPVGTVFELVDTQFTPVFNKPMKNGSCPNQNLLDYRVFFEQWMNSSVRFAAQKTQSVPFLIYADESLPKPSGS